MGVTGKTLAEFAKERLLTPLGMTVTRSDAKLDVFQRVSRATPSPAGPSANQRSSRR